MASETPFEFTEVSIEDVMTKAMAEFNSAMAGKHDKILAKKQSAIIEAVRKQIETDARLNHKLAPLVEKGAESAEIETAMSMSLSKKDIKLIKDAFLFETYQIEVYTCSKPGPKSFVSFIRGEKNAFPNTTLVSSSKIQETTWFQWASITVEIFMLILSAVGIEVDFNERQMNEIVEGVERIIQSSAFEKALIAFRNAWAEGGVFAKANAIFLFLKDSWTAGIFWKIMDTILSTMSTWDYIRAVASISAMIVAAFATGGAVLIAKIVLALDNAYSLVQKMINLTALESIQLEHTE